MAITYRGTTLPYGKHDDETTERAAQIIAFPAVSGTYEKDMGKRGRRFNVVGLIEDLTGAFKKATIEAWNDGGTGTLIIGADTYTNVKMISAKFAQAYKNAVTDKQACTFNIEFRKLR
jgi:hypothetical protein